MVLKNFRPKVRIFLTNIGKINNFFDNGIQSTYYVREINENVILRISLSG
jgi:hypothetical protein